MFSLLLALLFALPALGDPTRYVLEPRESVVGFVYQMNGGPMRGRFPVKAAELLLDFDDVRHSKVTVSLDASRARAGVAFATEAMKSETVLDVRSHPEIRFRTKSFAQTAQGAEVKGDLTIRGVTRPVTLNGKLHRAQGSEEGDFSRLVVRLSGVISRKEFGATGFPKIVGDLIALDITAALTRVD